MNVQIISTYRVIRATDTEELAAAVERLLRLGFTVCGPAQVTVFTTVVKEGTKRFRKAHYCYHQTLVCEEVK